ncbi:MAG: response regulator [Spirochaetales bacterium]|nr:response regulator [Spirochaetales bacterium]
MNRILIVDDVLENRKLLATIIKENSDLEVLTAKSGQDVINQFELIEKDPPDLILLDILMPKINGFHLAAILQAREHTKGVPIIFITALTDEDSKMKAFEAGGVDYISKPFQKQELLARINTHLRIKNLMDELKFKNQLLLQKEEQLKNHLGQYTRDTEMHSSSISSSSNTNLDEKKEIHQRLSELSVFISKKMGLKSDIVKKMEIYAPLCDIGESVLPGELLSKPSEFSALDRQIMEQHVAIGANMCRDIDEVCTHLVLYHHERWDGKGYPHKLFKENIPLEARILHVVDAFLAILSPKPYRAAHSFKQAYFLLNEGSGSDFDPAVVDVLLKEEDNIRNLLVL